MLSGMRLKIHKCKRLQELALEEISILTCQVFRKFGAVVFNLLTFCSLDNSLICSNTASFIVQYMELAQPPTRACKPKRLLSGPLEGKSRRSFSASPQEDKNLFSNFYFILLLSQTFQDYNANSYSATSAQALLQVHLLFRDSSDFHKTV